MVVTTLDERGQRILGRVTERAVTAVVAESDRLGERHVQAARLGRRHRYLGHFEGVREAGALVIGRMDEHLGLSGESTEGGPVHDPVPVALEARAPFVGLLVDGPLAGV